MDPATIAVISGVLEVALKVGVPAVQSMIATMGKDTITLADVQALKDFVAAAETYFVGKSTNPAA